MTPSRYRYSFAEAVPMTDLGETLVLAVIATESLHGESQARLDAAHTFDPATRTCVIDARTEVGRDCNRLFIGFATREFGPDSFTVERLSDARPAVEPVAA